MNQDATPKPLSGPLRSRINKLAHAQGLHHESALRATMQSQLEHARDAGESFAQLCERMARFETNLGG